MARAHLRAVLVDGAGNSRGARSVNIYQPGTTSAVVGSMYDAASSGNVVTNPRTTDARGVIEVWLEYPQAVDFVFTDDTGSQRVKGKTEPRDPPTPNVLYCEPSGNNSNSGDSWQTAKKDVLGAYDALPSGGGTIHFLTGTYVDSSNTDRGLWLAGANDPQYASVPTGWRQAKPLRLRGETAQVSSGTTGGLNALLRGGSPTDTSKPLFWFAGINQHISVQNVSNQALAKGIILGLQSDGSGTTNNSNIRFKNVTLRCEQDASYGPVVDITTAYWTWFEGCTFSANEQANWDDDERAAILIRGNGLGEGLIYVLDCEFNGGSGVKNYSAASVQIEVARCTQEGASTGDLTSAPMYWLASKGVVAGHAILSNLEQADATSRQPAVMVATGNDPSVVQVQGAVDVSGPATIHGVYINSTDDMTTSPIGHRQQGFYRGRVFGRTDAARRLGTGVSPHVKNLAPQDVTTWGALAGGASVATAKLDPYGGTNAAELTGASTFKTLYANTPSPAIASGDWVVFGIWAKKTGSGWPTNRPQFNITGAGNLFDNGNGTTATNVSLSQPWEGDGDWVWLVDARKITALPAAVSINCNIYCDTSKAMQYAYPVFCVIPTASYSDSEALAMVETLSPWSNSSLVTAGELTTLAQQKFNALGGLKVGGGSNISKILTGTKTYDPADMAADGDATSTTVTVTGAVVGDPAFAGLTTLTTQVVDISAHVSAADTVTVVLHNKNGAGLNLASGTLNVTVFKQ